MSTSAELNPEQNEPSSQSGYVVSATNEPTIQEIRAFRVDELLRWILQKEPTLLEGPNIQTFKGLSIPGMVFLNYAGNYDFFRDKCRLPVGVSQGLADLGSQIISKYYHLHCTHHRDCKLTTPQVAANKPGLQGHPTLSTRRVSAVVLHTSYADKRHHLHHARHADVHCPSYLRHTAAPNISTLHFHFYRS